MKPEELLGVSLSSVMTGAGVGARKSSKYV